MHLTVPHVVHTCCAMPAGEVPGLQNLGKSFLSIDTEGCVLRFESAAKFLAPGASLQYAICIVVLNRNDLSATKLPEFFSARGITICE